MAQLVKPPTLGFGPGHDFTIHGIEPHMGLCAESTEHAWDSVSPSLFPSAAHMHVCVLAHVLSLSLSLALALSLWQNKSINNLNYIDTKRTEFKLYIFIKVSCKEIHRKIIFYHTDVGFRNMVKRVGNVNIVAFYGYLRPQRYEKKASWLISFICNFRYN